MTSIPFRVPRFPSALRLVSVHQTDGHILLSTLRFCQFVQSLHLHTLEFAKLTPLASH
jgi:hypothetical protein